jgi:WhiB family redox-sensing transcriptional regulator
MTRLGELFADLDLKYPWRREAACRSTPGMHFDEALVAQAKLVCLRCPVKIACLGYALEANELEGIWGGYTPDERRRLAKIQQDAKPAPTALARQIRRGDASGGTVAASRNPR